MAKLPENVVLKQGGGNENAVSYRELLGLCETADLVAIPLLDVNALSGLTSLLDAMAMAKPVVMTRNHFIDIDIEKEGIGIWVNAGDAGKWGKALKELLSHTAEARKMGRRGRILCERKYNIADYTRGLANAIKEIQTE